MRDPSSMAMVDTMIAQYDKMAHEARLLEDLKKRLSLKSG